MIKIRGDADICPVSWNTLVNCEGDVIYLTMSKIEQNSFLETYLSRSFIKIIQVVHVWNRLKIEV